MHDEVSLKFQLRFIAVKRNEVHILKVLRWSYKMNLTDFNQML